MPSAEFIISWLCCYDQITVISNGTAYLRPPSQRCRIHVLRECRAVWLLGKLDIRENRRRISSCAPSECESKLGRSPIVADATATRRDCGTQSRSPGDTTPERNSNTLAGNQHGKRSGNHGTSRFAADSAGLVAAFGRSLCETGARKTGLCV